MYGPSTKIYRMTPPHIARPFVLLLIQQGFDDAAIVSSVRMLGLAISERTVRRIRHGEKRTGENRDGSMNLLNAGERRLAKPARCPVCRDLITVSPCRVCGSTIEITVDQIGRDHVLFENGQTFLSPHFGNEGIVIVGVLRVRFGQYDQSERVVSSPVLLSRPLAA